MKATITSIVITAAILIAVMASCKQMPTEEVTEMLTTTAMLTTTTETTTETTTTTTETTTETTIKAVSRGYEARSFIRDGEMFYGGWKFTWYSENVLPGRGLKIPGRYSDGNFVRDEDDYIVLACIDVPKGTVIDTPFGEGKVYDDGCPHGVVDVYTSW